jgi:O-antigen/teichoic acid export membrane protein
VLALLVLCGIGLLIVGIAPELVIKILFGSQYIEVANILLYVCLGFTFISLTNMMILYKISINEFRIRHGIFAFFLFALEALALIFLSNSIIGFSIVFMATNFATLFLLLIFTRLTRKT